MPREAQENSVQTHAPWCFACPTQWGCFHLTVTDVGVKQVYFPDDDATPPVDGQTSSVHAAQIAARAAEQIARYVRGRLKRFQIDVDMRGTPFQCNVWLQLLAIPYGSTLSYAHVAQRINRPKAARAVGQACGRNPVPLIVPCHRVLSADRRLGGFSGGLHWKQRLLELERVVL